MNFDFHPEAERELHEAALRYELDVPGLGLRFADEVERVVEMLLDHLSYSRPLRHLSRDPRHTPAERIPPLSAH